ncbi:thiamine phosphate synthase [Vibrio coralliilyticus]|uniref:thiamine phosphate synthase n=1 Tax=Vibrio coralliilyticus TaxID=190893 RepID=UPI0009BB37F4|nr:thiamine phosphate synthase [Vibrio coralliilyticus]QOU31316.1 thiamine phosphate synthase [Vibrio coralliilyticus]
MLLPAKYAITRNEKSLDELAQLLALQSTGGLCQLRAKSHSLTSLKQVIGPYVKGIVLVNSASYDGTDVAPFHGVHLTSKDLSDKALVKSVRHSGAQYLAASCHNEQEIELANQAGCDFITISPVEATNSHPDATPIGWQRFAELSKLANMPTFALGGQSTHNVEHAQSYGAHGVAGISDFWKVEK